MKPRMKTRTSRTRRGLLALFLTAASLAPVTAATTAPAVPAPAPAQLAPVSPDGLTARYAANRSNAATAAGMAAAAGADSRARKLLALADPARNLLSFDGRGGGRIVEVLGDLATADHVAVIVPGSDTSVDTYDGGGSYKRLGGGALALRDELAKRAPSAHTAVVTWLGYTPPETVSTTVLTPGRADSAKAALRGLVADLHAAAPGAGVSLLCHSYGSVVCGRAAPGLNVEDIVLYGSPGTGADSVRGLRTNAVVWVGRGGDDWIADIPHVGFSVFGTTVGLGADPADKGFGARRFPAGDGGHSDYLKPGSVPLGSMARIVLDQGVPNAQA